MGGLLKKDLLLLKTQRNFLLIVIVATLFIGYNSDESFAVSYLTFLSSFLLLSSFSYDDNGGCVSFLLTLPVSRSGYVREKYALGLLLTASGWVIGELVDIAMSLVKGNAPHLGARAVDLVWLCGFWMFIAVLIPFLIKYGVERGRLCVFFVIMFVVAAGYFGEKLLTGMNVDAGALLAELLAQKLPLLLACALAVTSVVLAVSYGISMQVMRRKEF